MSPLNDAAMSEGNTIHLEAILATHPNGRAVSEEDAENVRAAAALGATEAVLVQIRDAQRIARGPTIVLPKGRFEHLSRGRGRARKGRGDRVQWGERTRDGYVVGPGVWVVGSNDGFNRKSEVEWTVKHVQVGAETWTIAD